MTEALREAATDRMNKMGIHLLEAGYTGDQITEFAMAVTHDAVAVFASKHAEANKPLEVIAYVQCAQLINHMIEMLVEGSALDKLMPGPEDKVQPYTKAQYENGADVPIWLIDRICRETIDQGEVAGVRVGKWLEKAFNVDELKEILP